MRKNFVLLIGAVALIGSATHARAGAYGEAEHVEEAPAPAPAVAMEVEEEFNCAEPGPYLGVSGMYGIENFDATGPGNEDNSPGFQVVAGYRIVPNFAVEAMYEYFHEFDDDGRATAQRLANQPVTHATDHYDGWATTINAKAYPWIGSRWQPYGAFGIGYIDINGHNVVRGSGAGQGVDVRLAVGMDACVTEHISIAPEIAYVLPFNGAENFDIVTLALGLRYKF